jgi:sorbitol/mannitol transport system substrate-binding protein
LPYCDVSNVLIYRADLFDTYDIAVPETLDELRTAAVEIQNAVRTDGTDDFYGIAIRGAPNCGLNFWMVGSTWGPSFGARWYDEEGRPTLNTPELRAAVDHYIDLIRRAGPPESPTMDFMDCMACYSAGRAAMTIEPANEASILYDEGGPVADGTKTALIPAGPLGTRHAGLYCPPYAIPSLSQSKKPAWDLARFLCAPEQVLEDAQNSGFVEVSRNSVLEDPAFIGRFRPELVETTVATRAFARGERPVTRFGMEVGDIIGDEIVRVLTGELTTQEAMRIAEERVGALGAPG